MFFRRLRQRCQRIPFTGLVERIATRCQHSVWLRVRQRAVTMTVPQAAGYIRVRAAAVIERELAICAAEVPEVAACHWPAIAQAVRQRVLQRVLADTRRRQQDRRAARRAA